MCIWNWGSDEEVLAGMEVSVDAVSRSGSVAAGVNKADNFESLLSFPFSSAALFFFCAPLANVRFISVKNMQNYNLQKLCSFDAALIRYIYPYFV